MHIGTDTGALAEGAADETYISEATRQRIDDAFVLTDLGLLTPTGGGPIHGWHLTGWDGDLDPRRRSPAAQALISPADAVGGARASETIDERRLVTALFADFTGVADVTLSPAELDDVLARLVERLSAVAVPYAARVARYARDAVFVFFGAPVAHEDDPARALLTAMGMHREFEAAHANLPAGAAGLGLHIGVNSGHVVSGAFGGEIRADCPVRARPLPSGGGGTEVRRFRSPWTSPCGPLRVHALADPATTRLGLACGEPPAPRARLCFPAPPTAGPTPAHQSSSARIVRSEYSRR